ncbi:MULTISPECIES: FAD-dependent oxidoreductase [unclassified Leptolyngbya]|uniref:NAD(P)/FAD-dependent oxidoreductase n=1 Tax=unclassified Leptolyngbya TaxID=2650499 RepID=UPI001686F905|nr:MULTISPECIES: FAD-dependent oxidoreductase [unclassified Leptolyngbya]MBD1910369.1 FAD-binding oxidoreductase [Leptolyngbya sp. FACHB-8]MBD2155297.1 FAD-binding oxidoreductase [Leptolyngbya sp. FACHB-16]
MTRVIIVGCGIIGATIAYELSQIPSLTITVLDQQPPAQGSTGAALGVLMGAISHKVRGRAWQLREFSLRRYETLIPELETATGTHIPYNRQGIVLLRLDEDNEAGWRSLAETRQQQGWSLELWDAAQMQTHCPQVAPIVPAVYSPQDRQLHPAYLTEALVTAARGRGVTFLLNTPVEALALDMNISECRGVHTRQGLQEADWIILASGLGTTSLTQDLETPLAVGPVLGQAARLKLSQPMGHPDFQPVITGYDIHIVPLGQGEYWVGATVEFPPDGGELAVNPENLTPVLEGATALCPTLAQAEIVQTWSGLRPRPSQQPAPVIEVIPGATNVILATGHYRNGVLLAPATAERVKVLMGLATDSPLL